MRILFTIYRSLGYGGAEVSTLNLARELSLMGHEVIFASTQKYEGFKTYLFKEFKFPIFQYYNWYLKNFLREVIKKEGIDVVHSHDRMTTVGAIKAAKSSNVPVASYFRDYWFCCPRSSCLTPQNKQYKVCNYGIILKHYPRKRLLWDFYKWFTIKGYWKTIKKADAKFALSNAIKRKLDYCGITENVFVAYGSRDLKEFENVGKNYFRDKYNLKEVVVSFVGSFSYAKGIMNLLKIIPKIVKKNKNVSFLFVGDGNLMDTMKDFVKLNRIEDFVVMTGRLGKDEIPKVYADSDLIVFPNLWEEPFSGGIIESMASSKPLLASIYGGNGEAILDGENGFLINPNDLEEFEEKLDLLIRDGLLRKKMGRMSKELSKKYSNEMRAKETEQIYNNLIR